MKKKILGAVSIVLILCVAVGATLAYLYDTTDAVVNTFSFGKVNITLAETTGDNYAIIPGDVQDKDPTVTVLADSEDAYVFVEVLPSANLDTFVTYTVNSTNWQELVGKTGPNGGKVYAYKEVVAASASNTVLDEILTGDQITIKTTFDEADQEALNGAPVTLTFKAYAIQAQNIADVDAAWTAILGELA